MLAKAKLASSITFIVLASFTIVTYDRQNMFIIQATDVFISFHKKLQIVSCVALALSTLTSKIFIISQVDNSSS